MDADIENPDPDGCVAVAEPSRKTFKERLVRPFLRNPNCAGGGDSDVAAAEPPNGVGGIVAVAADPTVPKTVRHQCGWRNRVLYACSAIVFLGGAAVYLVFKTDAAHIGYLGGLVVSASLLFAALDVGSEVR